jgi:hypothetical protein
MAVKERSFWSTTSGVVTGIAGTLTGVVGLVTLAAQMGWIGGGDGGDEPANVQSDGSVATTVAPGAAPRGGSGSGTQSQANAVPVFSVDPTSLSFDNLTNPKATVKVVNEGTASMRVQGPRIDGANPSQFSATSPTCTGRDIAPARSCEIEVTFKPDRSGTFRATLVVQVDRARPQEVGLSGQRLI